MKNKVPSTLKDSLAFDWWKYLVLVVALCVGWHYVYKTKNALKDYEIINIYANAEIKEDAFSEAILKEHGEHGIAQTGFTSIGNDAYTQTLLSSKALLDGDLLLLYQTYADPLVESRAYVLDDALQTRVKSLHPDVAFLSYESNVVGVKVFEKDNDAYNSSFKINSCFAFAETTYLFVNKNSTNASSKGTEAYSQCAIDIMLTLLEGVS